MDDSVINPLLLSSSIHLENVELLIKNLEKQTVNIENFEDILNNHNYREDLITKSFSTNNNNFHIQNNKLKNNSISIDSQNKNFSIDSLVTQDYLFNNNNNQLKKQQIVSTNDEFTWDDEYDTRIDYSSTSPKNEKTSSNHIFSNANNNMNDWSLRSSFNTLEQSFNQLQHNPYLFQQNLSQSPSTSWRQMKENRQITADIQRKETRSPSPLNLYKIFQQKSNMITSSYRNTFQLSSQQNDSIISNHTTEKSKSFQSYPSSDQAIQTSILLNSSSKDHLNRILPKSESHRPLSATTSNNKSLPDLSFISQYSKDLPRSRAISLSPLNSPSSINIARTTPSPTLIQQQKQESDRPRTLKSIKRYKNNKHSTEPLGVFYSPQLRKTFATIPTSSINTGLNTPPTIIKMKLPLSSSPQPERQKLLNLKFGPKANSCDIQAILQDQKPSILSLNDKDLSKQHCIDIRSTSSSTNLNTYIIEDLSREYYSEYNLKLKYEEENQKNKSVSCSENISKHILSPCNPKIIFNDNLSLLLNKNKQRLIKKPLIQYGEMRRCQTDIIVVDPILHLHSFTDSPPNEFRLQQDKDDEILIEKSHINIIPSSPLPLHRHTEKQVDQPLNSMNTSTLDDLTEKINNIVKHLFEIKRSDKVFFLNNENNLQLDSLLKNDLCTVIQNILEHGRKDLKKITLWKIIETSIEQNTSSSEYVPEVYYEAKQIAQNVSSYWLYRFQAFIFALLNKNELINWLYYLTRQKDIIQRYYQSPDALILVSISSTFNLFERIMTQLEKLTTFTFRLTYNIPNNSSINHDQLNTSMISTHSTKTSARDWVMTISRRTPKNITQPTIQRNSNDTFRSTLSRKFNGFFTKTNTTQQKKSTSVVTTKLPEHKQQIKSPGFLRRPRLANVFSNSTATVSTNQSVNTSSPKLNSSVERDVSLSLSSTELLSTFQSKISRPSLNVDKPKSARYRSKALPSQ